MIGVLLLQLLYPPQPLSSAFLIRRNFLTPPSRRTIGILLPLRSFRLLLLFLCMTPTVMMVIFAMALHGVLELVGDGGLPDDVVRLVDDVVDVAGDVAGGDGGGRQGVVVAVKALDARRRNRSIASSSRSHRRRHRRRRFRDVAAAAAAAAAAARRGTRDHDVAVSAGGEGGGRRG